MDSLTQILRFGMVGGIATGVHLAVFYSLHSGLHVHPTIATTIAFCCAVGLSYGLNRSWTFRASGSHTRHFPRFAVIALGGLLLNAAIMQLGVEVLGWSPTTCLAIIIIVLPGCSFLLQRHWGFR